MILVRIAARNVRKNWRHSLAAMLSIAAGFLVIVLFEGYMSNLRLTYRDMVASRQMLGDVLIEKLGAQQGMHRDDWEYQLNPDEQLVIEQLLQAEGANVRARVRVLNGGGILTNGNASTTFIGVGHDVAEGEALRAPNWVWNTDAGKPLSVSGSDQVLVGHGLAAMLGCAVGEAPAVKDRKHLPLSCPRAEVQLSTTTESGRLNALEANIVGRVDAGLKEIDARYVTMPLPLMQRLFDTHAVSMYTVKLSDRATAMAFSERLRAAAAARGISLYVGPWEKHPLGDLFRQGMDLLNMFRVFIGAVVIIVAGMSVLNVLVKSVRERTREIGTLRSIGFRRKDIVALFSLEGALLAVFSIIGGGIVALVLAWLINHANITYKGGLMAEPVALTVGVTPIACLAAAALLVLLAVLAAILPARRASVMKISDALGHV